MKHFLSSIIFKKKVVIGLLALYGGILQAQITSFPWTETFEDSSPTRGDWTQIYEVNNMSWTFASSPSTGGSSITAYEGTKFANYPGTSHNFDKTKLVSPVLDLSGVTDPTISFHYRNPLWSPDQNWLRVFYRTSATAPWVQIIEYHDNITTWTPTGNLPLPSPSSTYQIAIECETDYGYSTTVDAVVISGSNLAINEVSTSKNLKISYYPNPVENTLYFRSKENITEVSILNMEGRTLKTLKINDKEGSIDVSSLNTGIYFINGKTKQGSESFKIIKK